MAKGNQKYERQATEKEQARSQGEYDSFLNQFLGRSAAPTAAASTSKSGFTTALGKRGGLGGEPVGTAGARPGLSTESSRYKDLIGAGDEERDYMRTGLRGMAETGGLGGDGGIEDYRARYQGALGSKATANLSDFTEERGYYKDFADTGGYTGADTQRIQAQAARNAPTFYNALRDQQGIAASRMGANAGAGAGLDMKMARQAAQGAAGDKLAANIGLKESVNKGKQYGIGGLESTKTEMGRQSLEQAALDNQYNIGAGGITADAERNIQDLKQKGQIAGYGGLMDLYGSSYAPQSDFEKTWLSAVGDSSKSTQGNRGLQLQNDEVNRSRLAENIIGAVGAAGGAMTGMGALGMFGKGGTPSTNLPMNTGGIGQYTRGGFNPMMQAPPLNNTGMFGQNASSYGQNIGLPQTNFNPNYNPAQRRLPGLGSYGR